MKQDNSNAPCVKEFSVDMYRNEKFEIYYEDKDLMILRGLQPYAQVLESPEYQGHTRMDWNEIMFCLNGSMQWRMKGVVHKVEKNSVIVFPSKFIVDNVTISKDVHMLDICISNSLLNKLLGADIDHWNRIVYQEIFKTVKIPDMVWNELFFNFEYIRKTHRNTSNEFYTKSVYAFMQIVIYTLLSNFSKLQKQNYEIRVGVNRGKDMFDKFLSMLTTITPKRHPIRFYANKLAITTNYLTILCKQYSGKSASEWILEYELEEVRFYLTQSNMPIKEVATLAGFDNVAFFGKFVKHHFGCTPLEYRRKAKSESFVVYQNPS